MSFHDLSRELDFFEQLSGGDNEGNSSLVSFCDELAMELDAMNELPRTFDDFELPLPIEPVCQPKLPMKKMPPPTRKKSRNNKKVKKPQKRRSRLKDDEHSEARRGGIYLVTHCDWPATSAARKVDFNPKDPRTLKRYQDRFKRQECQHLMEQLELTAGKVPYVLRHFGMTLSDFPPGSVWEAPRERSCPPETRQLPSEWKTAGANGGVKKVGRRRCGCEHSCGFYSVLEVDRDAGRKQHAEKKKRKLQRQQKQQEHFPHPEDDSARASQVLVKLEDLATLYPIKLEPSCVSDAHTNKMARR